MPKLIKNIKSEKFYENIKKTTANKINKNDKKIEQSIQLLKNKYIESKYFNDIHIEYKKTLLSKSFLISFFDSEMFCINFCSDLGLSYSIEKKSYFNNTNHSDDFKLYETQYDIFKKCLIDISKNINSFYLEIENIDEIFNDTRKLKEDLKLNNKYLQRSQNINVLSKITKSLALNEVNDVNAFIETKYLIDNEIRKLLSITSIEFKFVKYELNKDYITFEEDCVKINGYNSQNEEIIYEGNEISKSQLKEKLKESFSIDGKIIENIETMADYFNTPYSKLDLCFDIDYEYVMKKINPLFIKKNIKDF